MKRTFSYDYGGPFVWMSFYAVPAEHVFAAYGHHDPDIPGVGLWLKGPKAKAYFSERYGYDPSTFKLFGWRVWLGKRR